MKTKKVCCEHISQHIGSRCSGDGTEERVRIQILVNSKDKYKSGGKPVPLRRPKSVSKIEKRMGSGSQGSVYQSRKKCGERKGD